MSKTPRKQQWVDHKIQSTIVRRVTFYWLTCISFLTFTLLLVATVADPSKFFFQHLSTVFVRFWPVYLLMGALLPLTIIDAIRLSHRMAGPIFRLKKHLANIAEGQEAQPLAFRDDDFWQDLAEHVDQAMAKVAETNSASSSDVELVEA